ncbi:MAG: membrane dipeptidase [Steroidobacteraceae bacterium]
MIKTSEHSWLADAIVWDNHACMPLRPNDDFLPQLERCRAAGQTVISLNVGYDVTKFDDNIRVLAHFRHFVNRNPDRYILINTAADILAAKSSGRLGICFDLEGTRALNDQLSMVELFYGLGVRWMLMAYNLNNSVGGGCQDEDHGLTPFGRSVLDEMTRVGMVPCCSHTGWRTAMQVIEHVAGPVIFSHSNCHAVFAHPRNIPDELIKACAATGGVVGINGDSAFLQAGADLVVSMFPHIDHIVQLVGPDHVGLGLDYVYDMAEFDEYIAAHPDVWPTDKGYGAPVTFLEPERIADLVDAMLEHGYPREAVLKIIGGNHLRVASAVWK